MSAPNPAAPDDRPDGRGRAVALAAVTEFWERFGYYALSGLLPLFLTAPLADHGFGWTRADAVALAGAYSGLAFAAPALGGWIASAWLGERRAILLGGWGVVAGQAMMAVALASPAAEWRLPLFLGGLGAVVAGTGLIKPAVSALVGLFYAPNDPRRGAAYGLFMAGVWAGSFLANFTAGTVGERLGWAWGCVTAGGGMAFGLVVFTVLQGRLLGAHGLRPAPGPRAAVRPRLTTVERRRLSAFAAASLFTVLYGVAFYQKGGYLTLLARDQVDRTVLGWAVPVTWLLSVSTGAFVIVAPFLGLLFATAARRGRAIDPVLQQVLGLVSLAAGYGVMLAGAQAAHGGLIPIGWIVAGYVLFGLADVFIWPPQIALASAVAPPRIASLVIGVWYICIGAGSTLAGVAGGFALGRSPQAVFAAFGLALLAVAALLAALRPRLLGALAAAP